MVILTDKPLRRATSSPEATRWMALWAIELSEFDIQYRPWTAIKGQVIVEFITKFDHPHRRPGARESPQWSIHTDRSAIDKLAKLVWCFIAQKGTRSNAWSDPIFPQPITKPSMKS